MKVFLVALGIAFSLLFSGSSDCRAQGMCAATTCFGPVSLACGPSCVCASTGPGAPGACVLR